MNEQKIIRTEHQRNRGSRLFVLMNAVLGISFIAMIIGTICLCEWIAELIV